MICMFEHNLKLTLGRLFAVLRTGFNLLKLLARFCNVIHNGFPVQPWHEITSTQLRRRQELWRAARFRRLLERVSKLDQSWFAPRATEERNPHRHAKNVTRGHSNVRIAGDRRRGRVAAGEVIAIDPVSSPARAACGRDQRIELVLVHHKINAFFARQAMVLRQGVAISFVSQRPFRLRFDKKILAKVRHLAIAILLVEVDDFFQRFHRGDWTQRGEIGIQVSLEFVQQHFEFRIVELAGGGNVRRIDDDRAALLDDIDAIIHQLVHRVIETKTLAMNADARAFQAIGVEKLRVISKRFAGARPGRVVAGVYARERAEQNCYVGDGAAHRPGRVLAVRDGNDAGAADQSHRWFNTHERVRIRRTNYRAIGFGADADGREIRRHRSTGPGARAAWIAIKHVRIFRLPAPPAPAAGRMAGTKVGPLAQISFAEDYGARLAQLLSDGRILKRTRSAQRQRAGGCRHAIVRVYVVLDQNWNSMQGTPSRPSSLALFINFSRD